MTRVRILVVTSAMLVLLCFQSAAWAKTPTIEVSTDKEEITIGEEVLYTISVKTDSDSRALFPKPHKADLGDFRLKKVKPFLHKEEGKGRVFWSQSLVVTTFETGERSIPPQRIVVQGPSGKEVMHTGSVIFEVQSVLEEGAEDIRGLKDQQVLVLWWARLLGLVALLAVGAGLFFLWKRFRKDTSVGSLREPPRPPDEVALAALNELKTSSLLKEGKVKVFHIELSEIMRRYLGAQFSIDCLDMTTDELMSELKKCEVNRDQMRTIRSLLGECDLVKFAKAIPEESEAQSTLDQGIQVVEAMRPMAAPQLEEKVVA